MRLYYSNQKTICYQLFVLLIFLGSCVSNTKTKEETLPPSPKKDSIISPEKVFSYNIPANKRDYLFLKFWVNMTSVEFKHVIDSLKDSGFLKRKGEYYTYEILINNDKLWGDMNFYSDSQVIQNEKSNICGVFSEDKLVEVKIKYQLGEFTTYVDGLNTIQDNESIIFKIIEMYKSKYGPPTEKKIYTEEPVWAGTVGLFHNIEYKWTLMNNKIVAIYASSRLVREQIDPKYQPFNSQNKPRLLPCSDISIEYINYNEYFKRIRKINFTKDSIVVNQKKKINEI